MLAKKDNSHSHEIVFDKSLNMPKTLDILVLTVSFQLFHRQQWLCPTHLSLTPQIPTCTTIETPPKKEGGGP